MTTANTIEPFSIARFLFNPTSWLLKLWIEIKARFSLSKVFVALFAFVVTFNLAVGGALANGNFSQTCSDIQVDQSGELSASCFRKNQTSNQTKVNLNGWIANLDGSLGWDLDAYGFGNFVGSCEKLSLSTDGTTLYAACRNREHTPMQAQINLDEQIFNNNGRLDLTPTGGSQPNL